MTDKKSQRWQIWLIVGMPVMVIVLARVLFPSSEDERNRLLDFLGTRNNGVLIEPAMAVTDARLLVEGGSAWQPSTENTRWKLVVVGDRNCGDACRQSLYIARQIHKLMPKRNNRLERIYIGNEAPSSDFAEVLARDYPGVAVLRDESGDFGRVLDNAGVPEQRAGFIYLLDSRGYLVMYYTSQHSYKEIIKDLKVLL